MSSGFSAENLSAKFWCCFFLVPLRCIVALLTVGTLFCLVLYALCTVCYEISFTMFLNLLNKAPCFYGHWIHKIQFHFMRMY